jgi:hypothetical protein
MARPAIRHTHSRSDIVVLHLLRRIVSGLGRRPGVPGIARLLMPSFSDRTTYDAIGSPPDLLDWEYAVEKQRKDEDGES